VTYKVLEDRLKTGAPRKITEVEKDNINAETDKAAKREKIICLL